MRDLAVYVDLDGVIFDYNGALRVLGFEADPSFKSDPERVNLGHPQRLEIDAAIRGTDFFDTLPLMPQARMLWDAVVSFDPITLTAVPKFGSTDENYFYNPFWHGAAYFKRRAVERHFFGGKPMPDWRFLPCVRGKKHLFIGAKPAPQQLLIDDDIQNCQDWCDAGGYAILHTGNVPATIKLVNQFIANPAYLIADPEDANG